MATSIKKTGLAALLALLLDLLSGSTFAGNTTTLEFSWTAPETREDGSELRVSDLSEYRLYNVAFPLTPLQIFSERSEGGELINEGSITIYMMDCAIFAITAVDVEGLESAFSETVEACPKRCNGKKKGQR